MTEMIVTVANVSMTAPGVVHHDYTDAPLAPQSEDWRLVSWPHPDYALVRIQPLGRVSLRKLLDYLIVISH